MAAVDSDPISILNRDKEAAARLVEGVGREKTLAILKRAQAQMAKRLERVEGLGGAGRGSFTSTQLRATLMQVRAVVTHLKVNIKDVTVAQGHAAADAAAKSAIAYLRAAEQKFKGSTAALSLDTARMYDRAVSGSRSTVLRRLMSDPNDPRGKGILDRYGEAVVQHFEDTLQASVVARTPAAEVREQLVEGSPFLQDAPAHWAERIVRTETMNAHGAAAFGAIQDAQQQFGDMVKVLSSIFDSRTGADSYAVHGQIRRPSEAFESWYGSFMHPPDRPNDRGVVVPHRISWPIPPALQAKSPGQIASRWAAEGRKGSPPPQPLVSTVPLDQFGKPQPSAAAAAGEQPPTIAKPPIAEQERKRPLAWQPKHPIAEVDRPLPRAPIENEPLPPTPALLNPIFKKIGPQAGSNLGGVYEGSDGVQRYVKFYKDPVQAFGEHLAASLYADLGLGGLNTATFTHDGGVAFASEMLPEVKTLGSLGSKLTKPLAKKALEGFAADVLMANWDAAGLGLDNMVLDKQGNVRRIDNGAAFLTRAQGARKPLHALENPTEWESLFNPSKNPGYAKLAKAAGVTGPEDLKASILKVNEKIQQIANASGGWAKYVTERTVGMSPADQQQIVDMLEARSDFLKKKAAELAAIKAKPKVPKGEKPIALAEIKKGKASYLSKLYPATDYLNKQPQLPALKAYTGSSYSSMNRHLIGKENDPHVVELVKQTQEVLHSAKAAGHAVEGVVLRGISVNDAVLEKLKTAKTITFEAFTSTTIKPEIAKMFGRPKVGRPHSVLFRIRQSSAIPVDKVSVNGGEVEALLPHNTRFKVLKHALVDGINQIDLQEI